MWTPTKLRRLPFIRKKLAVSECPIRPSQLDLLEEQFLYLHIYKLITSQNKRKTVKREKTVSSVISLCRLLNNNHFMNVDIWKISEQITKDLDDLIDGLENTSDFPKLKYESRTHLVALIEGLFGRQRGMYEKKRALGSYLLAYVKIREDKNDHGKPLKYMELTKGTYAKHLKIYKHNKYKIAAERNQYIEFIDMNLPSYIRRERSLNKSASFYEDKAHKTP